MRNLNSIRQPVSFFLTHHISTIVFAATTSIGGSATIFFRFSLFRANLSNLFKNLIKFDMEDLLDRRRKIIMINSCSEGQKYFVATFVFKMLAQLMRACKLQKKNYFFFERFSFSLSHLSSSHVPTNIFTFTLLSHFSL